MIVQFSINPMDSEHISEDIARVTDYLKSQGVEFQVGPIGTSLQGEWDDVMPMIETCHRMVAGSHARVLTNITIDDHKDQERSLSSAAEVGAETRQ